VVVPEPLAHAARRVAARPNPSSLILPEAFKSSHRHFVHSAIRPGSSWGGALIGVYERFKAPVKRIGVGEKPEDPRDFKADHFARGLFG
jgi:hypothetical protein